MAILMVLVPAAAPVSDDHVRTLLAENIAYGERAFVAESYLCIRIGEKDHLSAKHMHGFLRGCALHFAVLRNRNVFWRPSLSKRKVEENSRAAAGNLLGQCSTHREHSIAGMRRNRHDFAGLGAVRSPVPECNLGKGRQHRGTACVLKKGTPIHAS